MIYLNRYNTLITFPNTSPPVAEVSAPEVIDVDDSPIETIVISDDDDEGRCI